MDDFFDPKDLKPDDSFFDPKDVRTVAGKEEQAKPDIGASGAALAGIGTGLAFGLDEEITSPFAAAALMATEDVPNASTEESKLQKFKRLMQQYQDVANERKDVAQEQHPLAYMGGAVAGSIPGAIAIPFGGARVAGALAPKIGATAAKIAGGATEGAVQGAITGAGEAEGDLTDRATGAAEGAGMGAVAGGAIPAVAGVARMGGEALGLVNKIPIVGKATEAFKYGAKGEALVGEENRKLAASTLAKKGTEFFQDLQAVKKDIGTQIEDAISNASMAGEKVDLSDTIPNIRKQLAEIQATGTKDAANYAAGVESELNKLFPIETPVVDPNFMGVAKNALPEGIITPAPVKPKPVNYKLTPEKAQDLKQAIYSHTPGAAAKSSRGLGPQEIEAASLAQDVYSSTGNKLNEVVPELVDPVNLPTGGRILGDKATDVVAPGLNEQYSKLMEAMDLANIKSGDLPEQIQNQIKKFFEKLATEGTTGDTARTFREGIVNRLNEISPDIAQKYAAPLDNIVNKLHLSTEIGKGLNRFNIAGSPAAVVKGAANLAGLGVNAVSKLPGAKAVGTAASIGTKAVGAVIDSPVTARGMASASNASEDRKPYQIHREYAKTAETATPESLVAQANDLRSQYGEKAAPLATILENMSKAKPESRRALMFTVLQNPAYKHMLGLNKENE